MIVGSNSGQGLGASPYGRRVVITPAVMSMPDLAAFYSALLLIFILFSRFFDQIAVGYRIPTVAFVLVSITMIMTGGIFQALRSKIGVLWLAFTIWMLICTATSMWISGSFETSLQMWPKAMLVFLAMASLLCSWERCAKAVQFVGWSVALLSLLAFHFGDSTTGRLFLGAGKLSNPNDLAQVLLLGLPGLWLIFRMEPTVSVKKLLVVIFTMTTLVIQFRTGSRGGMITFAILMIVVFRDASGRYKALVPLMLALVMAIGMAIVPDKLQQRFRTFTVDDLKNTSAESDMNLIAVASTQSRMELFRKSVIITLKKPIFGAGPGMFAEAVEKMATAEGKHVAFQETHNAFTQVSSENGIPGFLLYVSVIWVCIRRLRKVEKTFADDTDRARKIRAVAQTLRYMLLVFTVSSCFSSVAYQAVLPCITGLVVAYTAAIDRELAVRGATPSPAMSRVQAPKLPPRVRIGMSPPPAPATRLRS